MTIIEEFFLIYCWGIGIALVVGAACWANPRNNMNADKIAAMTLFWPFYLIKYIIFKGVVILNIFIDDMIK